MGGQCKRFGSLPVHISVFGVESFVINLIVLVIITVIFGHHGVLPS